MNKLIRYWNQNRKDIIKVIAIIAFVILILRLLNSLLLNSNVIEPVSGKGKGKYRFHCEV